MHTLKKLNLLLFGSTVFIFSLFFSVILLFNSSRTVTPGDSCADPLQVNNSGDDAATCGTLRYAVNYLTANPQNPSKTIVISLQAGSTIVISHGTLSVPHGVTIQGVCDNTGKPAVLVDGSVNTGVGFQLGGANIINCMIIGGFTGNQLQAAKTATGNTLSKVRVETRLDSVKIQINGGNRQSATPGSAFSIPLSVLVQNTFNNPVSGATVTFTAPASGASGTFSGATNLVQATSNASGIATAPAFAANNVSGSYLVTATTGTASVTFSLTNTAVQPSGGFTINHSTIDVANNIIPQQYLNSARALDVLFNHQSVGYNILSGLDSLASQNSTRYSLLRQSSPSTSWYGSNNGVGDFTQGSNGDPTSKINGFKGLIDTSGYGAVVKVAMMKFCWVDNVGDYNTIFTSYRDMMLYLENKYPNVKFVWWTQAIYQNNDDGGNQWRNSYNTLVRNYAIANNKILFDLADIESHDPNGNLIQAGGYPALYSGYSSDGGHLTGTGSERVARAWWWLMARISGWAGA